ncbi:MAG TPA: ATP-dependent helicase [Pyrinomonadaceae bacterium]|nr:ATP-dependent helicase [Pyrinomonadaceae bacterium]
MKKYVIKRDAASLPEKLSRYQAELNAEQFRVVTAKPQASLVVAGAGTGKTRTITYRVAYLIEQGISPNRILLATFTNRAAREMLKRVESLTGSQNVHKIWGGTFHRIGNLILRRHAESIGFSNNFSILDSEDSKDFVSTCVDEALIDTKSKRFPKAEVLQDIISYATNRDTPIEDVIINKYPYFEPLISQIKIVDTVYHARKRERNVMDYDDLLLNWKRLLLEKPAIAEVYAEQFQHILVDEYQDTNRLQAEIIDLLAVKHRNVMVVGDDAQAIFAWRGAEFKNIYEFQKRYPEAELYKLETNYRSTPEILGLANVSIAANRKQFPKVLQAVRKSKDFKPALIPCSDVEQQSAFIASRILELRDEGVKLEDIAVLYRSHYHCLELQLELTRRGIPYSVRSGTRFFEQAHIKDVTSFLKLIVNPRDELAWKRVLLMIDGVGKVTANKIWERLAFAESPLELVKAEGETQTQAETRPLGSVSNAIEKQSSALALSPKLKQGAGWRNFAKLLIELTNDDTKDNPARQIELILTSFYEEHLQANFENAEARLEDLRQLALYATRYETTEAFLSDLALIATENFNTPISGEDVIEGGDDDEMLTLSSVHQAKGLEWKVVFILWAADGRFPSPRALKDYDGEEEERRLWYVALTRAKDQLYLTYPMLTVDYSRQTILLKPSRFITECPADLFEIWSLEEEAPQFDAPLSLPEKDIEYLN